jgi:hypothetical protein
MIVPARFAPANGGADDEPDDVDAKPLSLLTSGIMIESRIRQNRGDSRDCPSFGGGTQYDTRFSGAGKRIFSNYFTGGPQKELRTAE